MQKLQEDILELFDENIILELSGCNKNRNRDRDRDRDRDREYGQSINLSTLLDAKHLEPTLILDDNICNSLIEEVREELIPETPVNHPMLIKS